MPGTIIHPPSPSTLQLKFLCVPLRFCVIIASLCVANAYLRCVCIIALHLHVYIAVVFLRFAFTLRVCLCDQVFNPCVPYTTS